MSKLPFHNFVVTLLLCNKDIKIIIDKLKEFGYHAKDEEISEVFTELRDTLPEALKQKIEDKILFQFTKPEDAQWLEKLEVAELYDFMQRKDLPNIEQPPYFKWIRDIVWIHAHQDIMSLVNILIFNQEDLESISKIIQFKYKKKIGIEAFALHMRLFWDCRVISAKEALYHCIPFRKNVLILRSIKSSEDATIEGLDKDSQDGMENSMVFHDANYIKWRIGYNEVVVPDVKNFLEKVKTDSYFKYYEAMNMIQSVEIEEEVGTNDKIGAFNWINTKKRNVEEQKARAAKHWMDLFVKAEESLPKENKGDKDFFEQMEQLTLGFSDEKLISIKDRPDILEDIKKDRQ